MSYQFKNARKRNTWKVFVVLAIILVAGVLIWNYWSDMKTLTKVYEEQKEELNDLRAQNEKNAYITNRDIKAGEVISLEDVTYDTCYSSMDQSLFAPAVMEGTLALVDMPKETQILSTMISTESVDSNIREEEFSVIHLSSNLTTNDYVDVRIVFPNGENYIVLSKKILKSVNLANLNCFMWLDEQETLLMSSAIVDAYLTPGTTLYTTKYIANSVQEASIVNYTPSTHVIQLINDNPNIIETAKLALSARVRTALEGRLNKFTSENYAVDGEKEKETKEQKTQAGDEFEEFIYGKRYTQTDTGNEDTDTDEGETEESEDTSTSDSVKTVPDTDTSGEVEYVD